MQKNQGNILILNDIRSTQNVGAMFRTADAAGITKIYLTGYTPAPVDRFGKKRTDIAKSALGAEEFIAWESKKNLPVLINKLKKEEYLIVGIEQADNSVDYKKIKSTNKNVFIMGTEVPGIPKNILNKCDIIAEIPMVGKKESLNVSVACGIALFRILNI
jgi:tRNA G18 (ribose-2'-O)-methylase SpoU